MGFRDWWRRLAGNVPSDSSPKPPARELLIFVPDGSPDPTKVGFEPVGNEEELAAPLAWIPKESSSFGVPVLDCRSVTRGFISAAENREQLSTFRALRSDVAGEHVRGRHPEGRRRLPCQLSFAAMGELPQGRLFTAHRLEYKWDVTCHGSDLVFSRSWTGAVEYRASLDASRAVTCIETAAEPSAENDCSEILTVDFLIRTFVLGEIVPFPLPEGPASPDSPPEGNRLAAMLALKRLGCDARFGCPENVLWAHRNLKLEV